MKLLLLAAFVMAHADSFARQSHTQSWAQSWSQSLAGSTAGHSEGVESVAFSPDGTTFVSGSRDRSVRLWDAAAWARTWVGTGHGGRIYSLAYSPDGATVASASEDNTIRLWNAETGATEGILQGHTQGVISLAFSPDGTTLASGSMDHTIRLWDLVTRTSTDTLQSRGGPRVAFSPDGTTLAYTTEDIIVLLDMATRAVTDSLVGHADYVQSVAFSPGGTMLASGSNDSEARLWNLASTTSVARLRGHTKSVNSVAFSPDSATVATGSADQTIRIWDIATYGARAILPDPAGEVKDVAFSPDGTTLVSGSSEGTIRVWDVATRSQRNVIAYAQNWWVYGVAFARDQKTVASGSGDGKIRLWDVATGALKLTVDAHSDRVLSIATSNNGRWLASLGRDASIKMWNLPAGTRRWSLAHRGDQFAPFYGRPAAIAFSPGGGELASVHEVVDNIRSYGYVFNAATGSRRREIGFYGSDMESVAYSPDRKTLAMASRRNIFLIDLPSYAQRSQMPVSSVTSMAFTQGGAALVSGSDEIKFWNASTGRLMATRGGHLGRIRSLAVSPDGSLFASGGDDGVVQLWDAAKKIVRTRLQGHWGSVYSAAFSPDGTILVTGGRDGTVRLWDCPCCSLPPPPSDVRLLGNFPNPFSEATQILLDLPAEANVSVDVTDMLGRLVVSLPAQNIPGGAGRTIIFDGGRLASGLYMYRVNVTTSVGSGVHMGSFVRVR